MEIPVFIVLFLSSFSCVRTVAAQNIIVIDNAADLWEYGDMGSCTYMEKFPDITCKTPRTIASFGFWSSCEDPFCDMTINIGQMIKERGGAKPIKVEILSYVDGDTTTTVRVQYQLTIGGAIGNVGTIRSPSWWQLRPLTLNPTLAWVDESVSLPFLYVLVSYEAGTRGVNQGFGQNFFCERTVMTQNGLG